MFPDHLTRAEGPDRSRLVGTRARLPLDLASGEHRLVVAAVCRYGRTGKGLHRLVDAADAGPCRSTQLEVADSRRVFACREAGAAAFRGAGGSR